MFFIGIDLGGTKLSGALFNKAGKIILKKTLMLDKRTGKDVGFLVIKLIKVLLKGADDKNLKVKSIGISVPGISYSKTGNIWAPNIPGWDNYPLLTEIKKFIKFIKNDNLKVKIDSDRACYILGEVWQGSAKGCKDAIFIAVGTGIGLGILVDGKVLRGSNDIAGATGWMALNRPFKKEYIPCGCFEYHASGEGIAKITREYLKKEKYYTGTLRQRNPEQITAHDVFNAYEKSDPLANKILSDTIELWGIAVANYVSLFNPEKIIFGGGVFGPALQFLDRIMSEARKWAQPISINQVELVASKLGSDAGLYGAGYLALKNN